MARIARLMLVFTLCLTGLPGLASAAPIVWQLTGSITSSTGSFGAQQIELNGVTVGTPLSFTLTLPETLVDFCPQDNSAFFAPGPSSTVAVTSNGHPIASGNIAGIEANATSFGPCETGVPGPGAEYVMRLNLGGAFSAAIFEWFGTNADVYPFAIPRNVYLGIAYFCGTCREDMSGSLTTVPEPGTLLLLGPSAIGAIWGARRRRLRSMS